MQADAPGIRLFSGLHLAMLGVFIALTALAVWNGRRLKRRGDERGERALGLAIGWSAVAASAWSIAFWVLPENLSWRKSLPLELCDLAGLVAPVALILEKRWSRTLLYFWGIGLSTQGLITPTVMVGPETVRFWIFWATHISIVLSAVYDLLVRGYRPSGRDLGIGMAVTAIWVVGVFALNIVIDGNYGYVGRAKAGQTTVVDLLGEWPLRVVWMTLITIAWMSVLWAVWKAPGLRRRGRGDDGKQSDPIRLPR